MYSLAGIGGCIRNPNLNSSFDLFFFLCVMMMMVVPHCKGGQMARAQSRPSVNMVTCTARIGGVGIRIRVRVYHPWMD